MVCVNASPSVRTVEEENIFCLAPLQIDSNSLPHHHHSLIHWWRVFDASGLGQGTPLL